MIKIEIKTGNAAFEEDKNYEIARILRELADKLEAGREPESINDYNGNPVCKVKY